MSGKLLYASNMSLDGFTEEADGGISWAPMSDELFVSITEVMAATRTYLYGRRMYETLAVWETMPELATQSDLRAEYARVWQSAAKVVYSSTLTAVTTRDTRIEPSFDADAVAAMKREATSDLLVGGPTLAAEAFRAGLVDECVLWVSPIVLGGRNPALPVGLRLDLELLDERRFENGVVRLQYRVA